MIDEYFDEIDASRTRRAQELSEIKRMFAATEVADRLELRSKAVIVLSYAVWEGFYNECVEIYCRFFQDEGLTVSDAGWNMLVGALSSNFERLRSRNHSHAARLDFVEDLQTRISECFSNFDVAVIEARSNLDFDKLRDNYRVLQFDISSMQPFRNRIKLELVGWRHAVAHGDSPNLVALDVERHLSLVQTIMLLVADTFQSAMLDHA